MRLSVRVDSHAFLITLVILIMGEVYLWYALPTLDIAVRLSILTIAASLIVILASFLGSHDQVEASSPGDDQSI